MSKVIGYQYITRVDSNTTVFIKVVADLDGLEKDWNLEDKLLIGP